MRAAVYYGKRDLRIETLRKPIPGRGELLIEVATNGICGTDLHLLADGPGSAGVKPPFVLGHEFAGVVAARGDDVDDMDIGSIVAVEPMLTCGKCLSCLRDMPNLCKSTRWYGLGEPSGGLSETVVVTRSALHLVPAGLDARIASLAEPLAVGMHAVNRSGLMPGQTAAVIGCGPIGISVALCLRARGIENVAAVETSASRRSVISALGFECVLPPGPGCIDAVREWSGGLGCDATFETAGVPVAFDTAFNIAAKGATIVLVALHTTHLAIDARRFLFSEKRLAASYAYNGTFPEVLRLLADGRIPTRHGSRLSALRKSMKGLAVVSEGCNEATHRSSSLEQIAPRVASGLPCGFARKQTSLEHVRDSSERESASQNLVAAASLDSNLWR